MLRAEQRGVRNIVYAELGNVSKYRPMTPPTSNSEQSVIYSDIKAPTEG